MPENHPRPIRLTVLAPGHFHAALVLKRMRPEVDPLVRVFAPAGDDLDRFRTQVDAFNARVSEPTAWRLEIVSSPDWLERFRAERPGNTAIIAGRNKPKIDLILAALESGLNVLADKPWIIKAGDRPKLEHAQALAQRSGLVAWDLMTERHETTNRLLLALVRDESIFGDWNGSLALSLESVHCLRKTVAGATLRRPAWWFDESVAGDALADVGTHLVDLAVMAVAPERIVRADDVRVDSIRRWPLQVGREDYRAITGTAGDFTGERLPYAGNGTIDFTMRAVPIRITARWEMEHPGGDWHEIVARGSRCAISSLQSPDGVRFVSIAPGTETLLRSVRDWCARSQGEFPGLSATIAGGAIHFAIPEAIRRDHESLFARVFDEYVGLFRDPASIPAWDWPNRLVRYRITTHAADGCSRPVSPVP
jgi:predicted dehydrogenase